MPQHYELNLPLLKGDDSDFIGGSIQFIGTATVIIRYGGFTILTDPNFLHAGEEVHLGYGMTSKRLTEPALDIESLPPIDFCVLSHYHGDHFDRIAEERLPKALPIVTTRRAAESLDAKGFVAPVALDRWETVTITKNDAKVTVTSMPGRHGPPLVERLLPTVMGSMLDFQPASGGTALRLYISGDTLLFDGLKEIPRLYPEIDLALFHLGGTRIMGMLLTMDAAQGVEAVKLINPRRAIPIHYNDYEVFKSSLEEFKSAVRKEGLEGRLRYLSHGEIYTFAARPDRIERAA